MEKRLVWAVVPAFCLALLLSAVGIRFLENEWQMQQHKQASAIGARQAREIERHLYRSMTGAVVLASFVKEGGGSIEHFDRLAAELLRSRDAVSNLQLAPAGVVGPIYPLEGNEKAIGHNLLTDDKRNKEALLARNTGKLTLAGPFELIQGGVAVIGREPVFMQEGEKERFWGFTAALILVKDLLRASELGEVTSEGYGYQLWRIHPDTGERHVFAGTGDGGLKEPLVFQIKVPNGRWFLSVAPLGGWAHSPWLLTEVAFALLFSSFFAHFVFYVLRQPSILHRKIEEHTGELKQKNLLLEQEVERRHLAEQELTRSSRRYQMLYLHTPAMLHSIGPDRCLVSVSDHWAESLGYAPEEVIGRPLTDFMSKESRSRAETTVLPEFFRHGRVRGVPYQLLKKSGETVDVLLSATAERDEQGRFVRSLAVAVDVTDLKRAEAELTRHLDQLETIVARRTAELKNKNDELSQAYEDLKASQSMLLQREKMASIGQLAAGVAHEINNPIGFVSSNLNSLGRYQQKLASFIDLQAKTLEEAGTAEQLAEVTAAHKKLKIGFLLEDGAELIEESLDGTERVRKIVQGLKNFSRVDDAESKLPADLNECLESTINMVWNEIKYKATLTRDFGELPPTYCNPQQLNQVFMNMLVNASQAIDGQGEIRVKSRFDDGQIHVSIADTGCGIPEENLQRLFEPFFTTKKIGEGTGLGMSISCDIVKKHQGEILVESTLGEGTVFTVKLPQVEAPKGP